MGKISRILRVFTFVFGLFFVGNALAAGYTCTKTYTQCNTDYYLTASGANNSCAKCPTGTSNDDPTCVGSSCCVSDNITVTCSAGKYIAKGSTTCSSTCGTGNWCPQGTFSIPASGATSATNLNTCPPGYPNSASGSGAITQCYSGTKSREWTGGQNACSCPANSTCTCDTCSGSACNYVAYSNSAGTGDGTIKSGCSSNSENCNPTVVSFSCKAGYYKNGSGCTSCSTATGGRYPNSAAGSTAITQCYSNTKSRPWTGSSLNGTTPNNCYSATWNACSIAACDYVAYSNSSGTGDGTIKSGCSSNSENCTSTSIKSVTANANYYVNGTSCVACSGLGGGLYKYSDAGNSGGNSACYANVTPGKYILLSMSTSENTCPLNHFCPGGKLYYNDTGLKLSCDEETDGAYPYSSSGTSSIGKCYANVTNTTCPTVDGADSVTCNSCTEKHYYDGTVESCTPSITGVTCAANRYKSSYTCPKCSDASSTYIYSDAGTTSKYSCYALKTNTTGTTPDGCASATFNSCQYRDYWTGTDTTCTPTVASVTASPNHYVSSKTCPACGGSYPYSDGGNIASGRCYTYSTKTGTCASAYIPSGCSTAQCECEYKNYASGTDGTCTLSNVTSVTAKANYYKNGNTCTSCSTATGGGYPYSAAGSTAITQCYSDTKSRPWSGSADNGPVPTNCYSVTAWNSCSFDACDYVAYSNSAGTGDGTIKSGCSTNSSNCTKTPKTVTANANYYVSGTSCLACSGLGGGLYKNSASGNTGGASVCYATTTAGKYISATSNTALQTCPTNDYCPATTLYWSNTGGNEDCPDDFPYSNAGATSEGYCYANCTTSDVTGASSVSGIKYADGIGDTCKATSCSANRYLSSAGACPTCSSQSASYPSSSGGTNGGGYCYKSCASKTGYSLTSGVDYYSATDTCSYKACDYTIKYNANGGSGTMSNTSATYDTSVTLRTNTFTRTGYTFAGWATTSSGAVAYTDGKSVINLTSTCDGTVTLYAKWTANSYSCDEGEYLPAGATSCSQCECGYACSGGKYSYNASTTQGRSQCQAGTYSSAGASSCSSASKGYYVAGLGACSQSEVEENCYADTTGSTSSCPNSCPDDFPYSNAGATSEGYCYANCITSDVTGASSVSGIKYSDGIGDTCKATSCSANRYLSSGACPTCSSQSASYPSSSGGTNGGGYCYKSCASKTGYSLTGGVDYYSATDTCSYEACDYTIKYNANGGSGTMANTSATYDTSVTLRTNAFTKTGCTFTGWATSSGGAVAHTDGKSVINLTSTCDGTVNLYAVWSCWTISAPNKSLTYNGTTTSNGSAQSCGNVTVSGATGTTVKYKTSSSASYSTTVPTLTNVGSVTVYYEVSKTGYTSQTGSYTCTMGAKNMTVSAPTKTLTYSGSAQSCANVSVSVPSSGASVTYSSSANGTFSATAPTLTNAGSTTVYYKVTGNNFNNASGSYTCNMNPATGSTVIKDGSTNVTNGEGTTAYPGTKSLTVTCAGGVTTATITNSATDVATASISSNTISLSPKTTGSATITVTCPATTNYNSSSATYKWTVSSGKISATATNKGKTYDGSALSCAGISGVSPNDARVEYSTDGGSTWSTTVPSRTNAGTTTVNYRISKTYYTPKTGSFTCSVSKAANPITISPESGSIAYPNSGTFTVSGAQGALSVSSSNTGVATASVSGTTVTMTSVKPSTSPITITVTAAGNDNYNSGSETYSLTVNKGTNTITISPTSGNMEYSSSSTFSVSNAQGALSVTSSASGVATASVSGTTVTVSSGASYGTATITVTAAGNDYYNSGSETYAVTVDLGKITLNNQSATSAGTTTIYQKYNTNVYLDAARSKAMTTSANAITVPTKTGYTFGGYYDSTSYGTQYIDASGKITSSGVTAGKALKANGTWYAKWTPNTYKVTLDNQDATTAGTTAYYYQYKTKGKCYYYTSSDLSTCIAGTDGVSITVPTKTGYTFGGYYSGTNGSGTQYVTAAGGTTNNIYSAYAQNVTLYAKWTACTYTVTYNGNKPSTASASVSGTTANSSHTYDTAKALTSNGYSLTGWTFAGWNTKSDGSGTSYANGASVKNLTSTCGGSVTLYAKWTANTYTVKYDGNGATSGSMSNVTHTYDVAKNLTTNAFIRTGYKFLGWSTSSSASSATYSNAQSVKNLTATAGGTVTLYAVWSSCPEGSYCPSDKLTPVACTAPYSLSAAGADDANDCYLKTTAGLWVETAGAGEVTCPGTYYCPGSVVVYKGGTVSGRATTGGRTLCPSATTYKRTTFPSDYYSPTIDSTALDTSVTGAKLQTQCRVLSWLSSARGKLYEYATFNATSQKYDTTYVYGWSDVNPGYYLTDKSGCGMYAYYLTVKECPADSFCPGKARVACSSSNAATVHTTNFGLESCLAPYSSSAGGTSSVSNASCYLTTAQGKYVASVGAGETACACGGYCAGGTKVYYTSGVGATTGGRTGCSAGTYNPNTSSTASSACLTTSEGYYALAGSCSQAQVDANCWGAAGSQNSCPNSCAAPYSKSAKGSNDANDCYLTTTATKYVATAGAGETACVSPYFCPGGATIYKGGTVSGRATTGGNTNCNTLGAIYTASDAGASVNTQCYAKTTPGKYVKTAKDATETQCPANSYCLGGTTVYYNKAGGSALCSGLGGGLYNTSAAGSDATNDCKAVVPAKSWLENATDTEFKACTAGYYCPGVTLAYSSVGGRTGCSGRTQYSAASASACSTVRSGYYSTGCNSSGNLCTGESQCTGATFCSGGVQHDCPSGYTADTSAGKTANTQCKISVAGGKYVAKANESAASGTCANWTYMPEHTVNYGSTSSCTGKCPTVTDGWTKGTGTGWSAVTQCYQTKTGSAISSYCNAGVLQQNATSETAWGSSKIVTALGAVAGAIVSDQTCTQCDAGTYSAGGTNTTCGAISKGCFGGAGSSVACPNKCSAGTYRSSTGGKTQADCSNVTAGCYGSAGATSSCPTVCATDKWSNAGASACTDCATEYGYHNSGTAAASHAGIASCKVVCGAGTYVPKAGEGCVNVGAGYWGAGGTVAENATLARGGQCTSPLTTIGYGTGANEADDCGRKLHAGSNVVYLRSEQRSTPSLKVKVGDKTFFGALSESLSGALKVNKDGKNYSVVNDWQ